MEGAEGLLPAPLSFPLFLSTTFCRNWQVWGVRHRVVVHPHSQHLRGALAWQQVASCSPLSAFDMPMNFSSYPKMLWFLAVGDTPFLISHVSMESFWIQAGHCMAKNIHQMLYFICEKQFILRLNLMFSSRKLNKISNPLFSSFP